MFARYGCEQIFLGDSTLQRLEECRRAITSQYSSVCIHVRVFDGSREGAVDEFFVAVMQSLGRVDFFVNVISEAREQHKATGLSIVEYDRCYSIHQKGVGYSRAL